MFSEQASSLLGLNCLPSLSFLSQGTNKLPLTFLKYRKSQIFERPVDFAIFRQKETSRAAKDKILKLTKVFAVEVDFFFLNCHIRAQCCT